MKRTEEMTEVSRCEVTHCAYNMDKNCHALGITVGDINDHKCDTMCRASQHARRSGLAGIGACKVANCIHNVDLECQADEVSVGVRLGQAECLTYAEK